MPNTTGPSQVSSATPKPRAGEHMTREQVIEIAERAEMCAEGTLPGWQIRGLCKLILAQDTGLEVSPEYPFNCQVEGKPCDRWCGGNPCLPNDLAVVREENNRLPFERKNMAAPWAYVKTRATYQIQDAAGAVVGEVHRGPIWTEGASKANARRIVACVNYCEGIATNFLEGASIGQPVFPEAERDTLTAQIVELTEALESALNSWRTAVLHLPGNITSEIDRIAKLRALLAKHGR